MLEGLSKPFAQLSAWVKDPRWMRATGWIRRIWMWVGWLAFGGLSLRFMLEFLSPLSAVAALLTLIAFCFPGWVVVSLLWGGEHATRRPELWLWGGWLGIAICVWLATIEGYATGTARGTWILTIDLAALIAWFTLSRKRGFSPIQLRPWRFGERVLWQLASLWILAVIANSYSAWHSVTEAGFSQYPGSFGADLMGQVSVAMMLVGKLPYVSPALAGVTAPLESSIGFLPVVGRYWMDPSGSLTAWVMVTNIFLAVGFGGVLVSVLRTMVSRFRVLVLTVFVVLFGSSFYWVIPVLNAELIPSVSTFGISSLSARQTISPLLNRWLLASPQTLLVIGFSLLSVAWIRVMPHPLSWPLYAGIGLMAGILAGIDSQIGWLALFATGAWLVAVWFRYPNDRHNTGLGLLIGLGAVVMALLPVWMLGIQSPHVLAALQFAPVQGGILSTLLRLIVVMGPMLVFGFWGGRFRGEAGITQGTMSALALILILMVHTSGDPAFGQRTGCVLLFILLTLGISRLSFDSFMPGGYKRWIPVAALIVAIPTVVVEYWSSRSKTESSGAILVHPADHTAAGWARDFMPENAVVQSHPEYGTILPGDSLMAATISWGSDLALRRMASGPNRLTRRLPDSLVAERRQQVFSMLSARQPDSIAFRATRLGIDYIYCGPNESRRYPRLRVRLSASPDLFEPVYESDAAGIYRVFAQQLEE